MLKLKKAKAASWGGNGMGQDSAEWTIAGHENVSVYKLSYCWAARKTHSGGYNVIAMADTRKELLGLLEGILN